ALSFDDRFVAFGARENGQSDIFQLDLETGTVVQLTNDEYLDADPSYRPDGTVVYSSEREDGMGLYLVDAASIRRGAPEPKALMPGKTAVYTAAMSGDLGYAQGLLPEMSNP